MIALSSSCFTLLIHGKIMKFLLRSDAPLRHVSPPKSSPVKQSPQISWSTWDDKKSDDEDCDTTSLCQNENILEQPLPTKQTYNWHSLVKSAGQHRQIDNETKNSEPMPKFHFDDSSFDALFED
ncbi:unnamed protein product [Rotaria sp. Silwood1]|nr:unnamed protein product [Rotaria sp. Silwood1]